MEGAQQVLPGHRGRHGRSVGSDTETGDGGVTPERWTAMGRAFGFPECCVAEFCLRLSFGLRSEPRPFDGTGFVPCAGCSRELTAGLISEARFLQERILSCRAVPFRFGAGGGFRPVDIAWMVFEEGVRNMNQPKPSEMLKFVRASDRDVDGSDWDEILERCAPLANEVFAGSRWDDPERPYPSGHEAMDNAAAEEFLVHASISDKNAFLREMIKRSGAPDFVVQLSGNLVKEEKHAESA